MAYFVSEKGPCDPTRGGQKPSALLCTNKELPLPSQIGVCGWCGITSCRVTYLSSAWWPCTDLQKYPFHLSTHEPLPLAIVALIHTGSSGPALEHPTRVSISTAVFRDRPVYNNSAGKCSWPSDSLLWPCQGERWLPDQKTFFLNTLSTEHWEIIHVTKKT